jgi:hypothetical protein
MASIDDLGRLLNELRRVSSPLARMKLLARGWRSIQRLGPGERRKLAKHVGVEGAENLIERMAVQKGRVGPALIQRALDKVRESDPGQLKELLHGLRDPVRRGAILERGVDALADELIEPEPEPIEEREYPAAAEATPHSEQPAPEPEILQPVEPLIEAEPESPPSPPVEPVPESEPEASAPPEPEPVPASIPAQGRRPEPEKTPEPERRAAVEPAVEVACKRLLERIERTASLTCRFRALREEIDLVRGYSDDQLEQLLGFFNPGWQRRRALTALLRAGLPESTAQATSLIEKLESPVSRRWCARFLMHERELSASERETLDRLAQ